MTGAFPQLRLRRLRRTETIRALTAETSLGPANLVYPLFIAESGPPRQPLAGMPGQYRFGAAAAAEEARAAADEGVTAFLLFGVPDKRDSAAAAATNHDGPAQNGLRAIRAAVPDSVLIADVCLCAYTDHGHCGVPRSDGTVGNDEALPLLTAQAVSFADAGADVVAPSDMMDGRVAAIREGLDRAGHSHTAVMPYAVKYASAFYGPFREACDSAPGSGDRRSYQMDVRNTDEALREARLDLAEGADMLMVKPAMTSLDIVRRISRQFGVPTAAYHVSGEYAMVMAAAEQGHLDADLAFVETALAIRRAGARMVVTYAARRIARALNGGIIGR